jgi:holo-[acyl-carrier protein] synthase
MPPPIPFPYPLRVGTDLCRIPRILRILQGKNGPRFIRRVLAPEELARVRPAIRAVLDDDASGNVVARAAVSAEGIGVRRPTTRSTQQLRGGDGDGGGGGKLKVQEEQHRDRDKSPQRDGLPAKQEEGEGEGIGIYKSAAMFLAGRCVF